MSEYFMVYLILSSIYFKFIGVNGINLNKLNRTFKHLKIFFKMYSKNISIIGLGRLGLCVGLCMEQAGYNILGVDIIDNYIFNINNKILDSPEPSVNKMLKESKNLRATTDLNEAIEFSDIIFIYVATPSSGSNFYDHNYLGKVLSEINIKKVVNKHIVIGCTVIPGYIRDVGNYLIKDCINTSLSYNPEFIAQGDIINGMLNPDFILIGEGNDVAGDKLQEIYESVSESLNKPTPPIHRMSPSSAEITKLSVNCFITTKIAFANMIGDVSDMSIDSNKFDILNAVGSDSRIGHNYLKPGYGFGGPCLPRDNRALGGYIKKMGLYPLIPEATDEANRLHMEFQANRIYESLKDNVWVIEGVGYKQSCNVPIIEESQKLFIGKYLAEKGVIVTLKDKKHMLDAVKLEYGNMFLYEAVNFI
jgi:UDPglucose 6-dehydrogenase